MNEKELEQLYDISIKSYDELLHIQKQHIDEIERLNKENKNLKKDFKRHIDRINELTNRLDKAIDYISDYEDYCDENECDCTPAYFKELLDILKGSDKE